MKVIYNNRIPFKGFYAITILEWVFVREEWHHYHESDYYYQMIRHESTHVIQERELLYVFFYLIYLAEYVINLFRFGFDTEAAYMNISFEREAYAHEKDPNYLASRRPYAQWRRSSRQQY